MEENQVDTAGSSTTPEQVQEREYTPIELKAIDQGWIPKEEFDGDESEFIDAPEFVRRGELFKKIETQSKELKAVRNALEAFKQHHSKVKEAEYNRALKSLQDARKQAFVDGEHERAFAIEEKIDEIKLEKEAIVKEAEPVQVDDGEYTEQFQAWVEKNSWYENNRVMRKAADALGLELHKEGYSPAEVLKLVEKEIKKEFKHKFEVPTKTTPSVEGTTRGGSRADSFQMTADERDIMRKIVATGVMSEADYIKELKATRKQ